MITSAINQVLESVCLDILDYCGPEYNGANACKEKELLVEISRVYPKTI